MNSYVHIHALELVHETWMPGEVKGRDTNENELTIYYMLHTYVHMNIQKMIK